MCPERQGDPGPRGSVGPACPAGPRGPQGLPGFTRRELEIIRANPDFPTKKEMAAGLGMAESTVQHHLSNIFDKVGCDNRLGLLVWSVKKGLVTIASEAKDDAAGFDDGALGE